MLMRTQWKSFLARQLTSMLIETVVPTRREGGNLSADGLVGTRFERSE